MSHAMGVICPTCKAVTQPDTCPEGCGSHGSLYIECGVCRERGDGMTAGDRAALRATAEAMTDRAMLAAAHRDGADLWLDAIDSGALDTREIADDLALGAVTLGLVRQIRDAVPALLDELDAAEAKLAQPCGSCHPCTEWAAETWRRSDGPIPSVYEVSVLRAELDEARAAARDANGRLDKVRALCDAVEASPEGWGGAMVVSFGRTVRRALDGES